MSQARARNLGLLFLVIGLALCALVVVLVRTMEKRLGSAEDQVRDLSLAYQAVSEGTDVEVPTAEEIIQGIKLPPGIPGEDGRDGRDGRDGITPACVFEPLQCRAPNDPDPNDPDVNDADPNDPEIQDAEAQDEEIQDPEIQDPEIDDPQPPIASFTIEWRGQTWVCTDPDGDGNYSCERQGGLLEPAP